VPPPAGSLGLSPTSVRRPPPHRCPGYQTLLTLPPCAPRFTTQSAHADMCHWRGGRCVGPSPPRAVEHASGCGQEVSDAQTVAALALGR